MEGTAQDIYVQYQWYYNKKDIVSNARCYGSRTRWYELEDAIAFEMKRL